MKTYIIDWGEESNGGRYALIQARSFDEAWWDADAIGGPFHIAELKIPRGAPERRGRYMEIDAPKKRYAGASFDELEWNRSGETG
jgi:hypothetical protein